MSDRVTHILKGKDGKPQHLLIWSCGRHQVYCDSKMRCYRKDAEYVNMDGASLTCKTCQARLLSFQEWWKAFDEREAAQEKGNR